MRKIIICVLLILVSIATEMITIIPWWSFLALIFFLGILLPLEKWKISAFRFGFTVGFLTWVLSTLYFESIYDGDMTIKISKLLTIPNYFLYIIIGFIGGILTALAFYSGFLLRKGREIINLDLTKTNTNE